MGNASGFVFRGRQLCISNFKIGRCVLHFNDYNRLKDKLLLVADLSSYIQLCYVSFLLVGVSFFAAS